MVGRPDPGRSPRPLRGATSRFSLRLPEDLHRRVAAQAHEQGVSINQFLVYAISSAVTEMEARAFFAERAGRYAGEDFGASLQIRSASPASPIHPRCRRCAARPVLARAVLGKVAARPALAGDELLLGSG